MNNKKDQFWYSHPTEYYTPMKNKLSQRKCMSRTDITVNERNQTPMSLRGTIPCTPISNRLNESRVLEIRTAVILVGL